MTRTGDEWSAWILERRYGGDQDRVHQMLEVLAPVRDAILDHAEIKKGERLLDVGCGDGLVGFGAIARQPQCTVIFSDVSATLIDRCKELAQEAGVMDRCEFLVAAADDLSQVADASVDVVTTRSVLIFVKPKAKALGEFQRVLRTGGRISFFEPINRYFIGEEGLLPPAWDPGAFKELADRVTRVFMRANPVHTSPMMDFDDRDLVHLVERAGFSEIHLRLHVDIEPVQPQAWEGFFHSAPNPLAPTFEEAAMQVMSPPELEDYVRHFRPLVEQGIGTARHAAAYVWARKSMEIQDRA